MFERKHEPVISRRRFYSRLGRSIGVGACLLGFSLGTGMIGYHLLEDMSWIDAFLNASMIMSGMGPVATLKTDAGKLFAGLYALYCGMALITAAAIILSPVVHRFFHRFHVEDDPSAS